LVLTDSSKIGHAIHCVCLLAERRTDEDAYAVNMANTVETVKMIGSANGIF
jgi:hypothetical protein